MESKKTVQEVLGEYLIQRDVDWVMAKLNENGYGIYDNEKLVAEVNRLRQAVLEEILEKYVCIPIEHWNEIESRVSKLGGNIDKIDEALDKIGDAIK